MYELDCSSSDACASFKLIILLCGDLDLLLLLLLFLLRSGRFAEDWDIGLGMEYVLN